MTSTLHMLQEQDMGTMRPQLRRRAGGRHLRAGNAVGQSSHGSVRRPMLG
jgi:hypothetical protein